MELGILHYFSDLDPIFVVVNRRLVPNGHFILTDYHPFAQKLLNMREIHTPLVNIVKITKTD